MTFQILKVTLILAVKAACKLAVYHHSTMLHLQILLLVCTVDVPFLLSLL